MIYRFFQILRFIFCKSQRKLSIYIFYKSSDSVIYFITSARKCYLKVTVDMVNDFFMGSQKMFISELLG